MYAVGISGDESLTFLLQTGSKPLTDWSLSLLWPSRRISLSLRDFYHQSLNETKRVKLCYFFAKNITLGKKVYGKVARKPSRPKFCWSAQNAELCRLKFYYTQQHPNIFIALVSFYRGLKNEIFIPLVSSRPRVKNMIYVYYTSISLVPSQYRLKC